MTTQIQQDKFIYFPIYLTDYVSDSRKLTMLQRGALIDLSVLYFQEDLKINYTKEQIYRLVFAFSKEEKEAINFILENYFTQSENKPMGFYWVSSKLNQLGDKILKRLNSSRENGKKGGRGKKKEIKPMGSNPLNPKHNLDESILNETKPNETKPKSKLFIKPTIQEIKDYCFERKNNVNPESFINYYEARGWKLKGIQMKDWKACVRTWEGNDYNKPQISQPKQSFMTKQQIQEQRDKDIYARLIKQHEEEELNNA
jgi:uncharacterized protein YdaU (DUF1376 family)